MIKTQDFIEYQEQYVRMNDGIKGKDDYPHNGSFDKINDAIKDYYNSKHWN